MDSIYKVNKMILLRFKNSLTKNVNNNNLYTIEEFIYIEWMEEECLKTSFKNDE